MILDLYKSNVKNMHLKLRSFSLESDTKMHFLHFAMNLNAFKIQSIRRQNKTEQH